jgi:hypothetical protein
VEDARCNGDRDGRSDGEWNRSARQSLSGLDGVSLLCVDGAVELHDQCPFVRSQQGEKPSALATVARYPDCSVAL